MLETLAAIDRALFHFINITLSNPVTDFMMPLITSDDALRIMYALAMVLILWKGNAPLRWMVLFSGLVLLCTDQTAAGIIKPLVNRPRPCQPDSGVDIVNLLVGCGGGKSMPSAHAANSFGQAFLFGMRYRGARWYLFGFAALISLSRVFVGVHYPGDIIVGAAIGALYGLIFAGIFTLLHRRYRIFQSKKRTIGFHSEEEVEGHAH